MQKITEKPLTICPGCGGNMKKMISSTSFVLKGSGWYVTDYGDKNRKSSSKDSEQKKEKADSTVQKEPKKEKTENSTGKETKKEPKSESKSSGKSKE